MPAVRAAIKITIVRPEGQAEAAGIEPGDMLIEIGGAVIDSAETLSQALARITTKTPAVIIRDGLKSSLSLSPGSLGISYAITEIEIPEGPATPAISKAESEAAYIRRCNEMIVTTAPTVEGWRVTRQLGVITAECVFGMNIFRDFFAAIRDVTGGRSESTQKILRDARETCLRELKQEAMTRGANAIIAVDLDYNEFSGDGKSMLFLVASGTAVEIEGISQREGHE